MLILISAIVGHLIATAQEIAPAPDDKAVVYFIRASSMGFAIKFTYLDSASVIGRFNGPKYIRYECAPGHHLFWARSENRDFVEAEVEAGKIYFIEAMPQMGALKAGVHLKPVDPTDEKTLKRILKLMKKKKPESFTREELEKETERASEIIERGLERYQQEKEGQKPITRLENSMAIDPAVLLAKGQ